MTGQVLPFALQFTNKELKNVLDLESEQLDKSDDLLDEEPLQPNPEEFRFLQNSNKLVFKQFAFAANKKKQESEMKMSGNLGQLDEADRVKPARSLTKIIMESWTGNRIYQLVPMGTTKS